MAKKIFSLSARDLVAKHLMMVWGATLDKNTPEEYFLQSKGFTLETIMIYNQICKEDFEDISGPDEDYDQTQLHNHYIDLMKQILELKL